MTDNNKAGFTVAPLIMVTVLSGALGALAGLALGNCAIGLGVGIGAGFSLGEALQQKEDKASVLSD